jgi:hypothetical protein
MVAVTNVPSLPMFGILECAMLVRPARSWCGSAMPDLYKNPFPSTRDDGLAQLLETLSAEGRATLSLAMRVSLPLIQQLSECAEASPLPRRDLTQLTS